jgi:MFS family permease
MLTTLYAMHLNASSLEVGIIVSLAALFPMLFAFYAGRVSDRLGYRIPLIFGSFGVSASLILPYFIRDNIYILYISQLIYGLAFIFLVVNIQNLVGSLAKSETRSQNYAIYSMGVSTANFIGPLVTGFSIDHIGYSFTYLFMSVMALVPGVISSLNLVKLPQPVPKEEVPKSGVKDLLGSNLLRKAILTSALVLIGVGIYDFYFPIFGKSIGLSASTIGILLSINAIAFFLVRFFMPVLVSRWTENIVIIGCLFISAGSFMIMPLFHQIYPLGIVSFLVGIGLGCGQPLSMVLAYNASPQGRTGEVLGLRLTVNKIVQFMVPILFGSVGSIVGAFPIFWVNAFILLTGGFWISRNEKNASDS